MADGNFTVSSSTPEIFTRVRGEISDSRGDVSLIRATGEEVSAIKGTKIYLNDTLSSREDSAVIAYFGDSGVLVLGQNQQVPLTSDFFNNVDSLEQTASANTGAQTASSQPNGGIYLAALEQAIQAGQNIEELLEPTAAGGDSANESGAASSVVFYQRTGDSLFSVSGFDPTVIAVEQTAPVIEIGDLDSNNQVNGINNIPTIDTATGTIQTESIAAAGDTVAIFTASDLDGDLITYSITSGNADSYFEIVDPASGVVTLTVLGAAAVNNDELVDTDYVLGVTANDGTVDSVEAFATVTFDGVNDVIVMDTATGSIQAENSATQGAVATFVASDLDGVDISYAITDGNASGYFQLANASSGAVTLTTAGAEALANDELDDTDNTLTVTASTTFEGVTETTSASTTVKFDGVNDPILMDTPTDVTLTENQAVTLGQVLATFTATDLDATAITYTMTGGSVVGVAYVEIDSATGEVKLTQAGVDAVADDTLYDKTLDLTVTATTILDGEDDVGTESVARTVKVSLDGVNDAPTLTIDDDTGTLAPNSINTLTGSGALTVNDVDTGDSVTVKVNSDPSLTTSTGVVLPDVMKAALLDGFTVNQNSWNYSTSENLDFLAAGETITLTYGVVATDKSGATSDAQTVIVTLTGPKLLVSENFDGDTEADGWINAAGEAYSTITQAGEDSTNFLGQIGKQGGRVRADTEVKEVVSKDFFLGGKYDGENVTIKFDFYEIDSWDNETFNVFVNDLMVKNDSYNWQGPDKRDGITGDTGTKLKNNIGRTNTRWSNNDEAHAYEVQAVVRGGGFVKLGFGAGLSSGINDESYGIDNIEITVPGVTGVVTAPVAAMALTATLIDGIVEGLSYITSSGLEGFTAADGGFNYAAGDTVTFSIGRLVVGDIDMASIGDDQVFLQDIAEVDRSDMNDEYLENMAVLLQSLDHNGDAYDGIEITAAMRDAFSQQGFDLAMLSSEDLNALIEATGRQVVSEDAAMVHVEDMLLAYTDLEAGDMDDRVADDVINSVDTTGNDQLSGEGGKDTLSSGTDLHNHIYHTEDTGHTDTIKDFDMSDVSAGGDVLNFADFLSHDEGEDITEFLHVHLVGTDTVITVDADGTHADEHADLTVVLEGVDLTAGYVDTGGLGVDQAALLQNLIDGDHLIVDSI
jgi:hypothetical protein